MFQNKAIAGCGELSLMPNEADKNVQFVSTVGYYFNYPDWMVTTVMIDYDTKWIQLDLLSETCSQGKTACKHECAIAAICLLIT